jgi:hypothetical protein
MALQSVQPESLVRKSKNDAPGRRFFKIALSHYLWQGFFMYICKVVRKLNKFSHENYFFICRSILFLRI